MNQTGYSKGPGRVLPFKGTGTHYFRQALSKADSNDLPGACASYQMALRLEPDNPEYILGMAEMLTGMGRFDDSNRVLLRYFPEEKDRPAECYFGMGCNFYGLMEYGNARNALERYLDLEPEGMFAYDAYDMLDALEAYGEENMSEVTVLQKEEALEKARQRMAEGELDQAETLLEKELEVRPDHMAARCDLALVWYCRQEKKRAEAALEQVLQEAPEHVQARCTRALLRQSNHDMQGAMEDAQALREMAIEDMDDLHRASLTLMELGDFAGAQPFLRKMAQRAPYDTGILHRQGLCAYALEEYDRAAHYYDLLTKIDRTDTIARYYRRLCKRTAAGGKKRQGLPLHYQVPMDEVVQRVRSLNNYIRKSKEAQQAEWGPEGELTGLAQWCLTLSEDDIRQAALHLIASFGDVWSERLLRDFALRREPDAEIKRRALGLLKHIGAKEPYLTYIDGQMMESRVSLLPGLPENLPAPYRDVLKTCLEGMRGVRSEDAIQRAGKLWQSYLEQENHYAHLTGAQVAALAAALEYAACQAAEEKVTKLELCRKYGVSMLRFNGALAKLNGKEPKA